MSEETTTITVKKNVKELLETGKGSKDWSSFLAELYSEWSARRSRRALSKLRELLTDEDIDRIAESSKKFRKELSFET